MTTTFIIQTTLEVAVAILIVVGFFYEDKVIAFETKVWNLSKNGIKKVAELFQQFKRQGKDHNQIIREKGDNVK